MDRSQDEPVEKCSDCCAALLPGTHPTYSFGVSGVLCFACAMRRGGRFDARHDRWIDTPDIRDLAARAQE